MAANASGRTSRCAAQHKNPSPPLIQPSIKSQHPPDTILMYRVRVVVDDDFSKGREEVVVSGY